MGPTNNLGEDPNVRIVLGRSHSSKDSRLHAIYSTNDINEVASTNPSLQTTLTLSAKDA